MKLLRFISFLLLICCCSLAGAALATPANSDANRPIRIGLTPALLHDQYSVMAIWKSYLQQHLGRPIEFVQRDSYRETMDLLAQNKLDFAWLCDYPFVALKDKVKLLAVPLYQGRPMYRAYLIVPSRDHSTRTIADLKGKVFGYADPYSNTGYLAPRFAIKKLGQDPATFFRKTFFTWSHRKLIESVASGLSQGAMVDSYVWDSLARIEPTITGRTRIVTRTEEYGFPPFVAHKSVPTEEFAAFQGILLKMRSSPEGKIVLERLNLDGFTAGDPALYHGVAEMMRAFGEI